MQLRRQLWMPVEQRHQLDRRAARLDQAPLIFVEGVFADLEQSARLPLRQLKLGAQTPDRFWRGHAVRFLLETAQRLVDDGHVLADVDALAVARGIIARQIDDDAFALVGDRKRADAARQRLSGFRRNHRLGKRLVFRGHHSLFLERDDRELGQHIRLKFHIEQQSPHRHVIDVLPEPMVGEGRHRLDEHAPVDAVDRLDDSRRDRTPTRRRRAAPTS